MKGQTKMSTNKTKTNKVKTEKPFNMRPYEYYARAILKQNGYMIFKAEKDEILYNFAAVKENEVLLITLERGVLNELEMDALAAEKFSSSIPASYKPQIKPICIVFLVSENKKTALPYVFEIGSGKVKFNRQLTLLFFNEAA